MPSLDAFSLDYLRLVLEIQAHPIEGYVDSCYGPVEATPDPTVTFRRLLTGQALPSQLAAGE